MKAAILYGKLDLRLEDIPEPVPGEGEVLVRVNALGICGSDIHYYKDGRIGDQVIEEPQIIGHEFMGVVEKLGPGAEGLEVGQRVAIEPSINCEKCRWCLEGRPNLCPNVRFYGTPPTNGALREYVVHPARLACPLPDGVSDEEGVLLEPLGVGIHAVDLARVRPGESVAVLGSGPVGLCVAAMAHAAGATTILMTDIRQYRVAFAERYADKTANAEETDVVQWLVESTNGLGPDVVFECAGEQSCVDEALAAVRNGGRAVIVGIPAVDRISFDMHRVRRKEIPVINVRRSRFTLERGVELMRSGQIELKPMATHSFPLSDVVKAFETVQNYSDGVIKAIVHPSVS